MNVKEIINNKRLKKELSKEEIEYVVSNFIGGDIKDYQISSLLMAITLNGMSYEETFYLTEAMVNSGDILDLSSIDGVVVDKHSTGGVGDKVTLILAPLLASLGIYVSKMSGKSLGFTGGTIDKLDSIPGFNTSLTEEEFIRELKDIKMSITSPTANLDIADKKIYALRDATSTVSSIPLIASSIMSKKIAAGASLIVIDVKVGSGALIKNLDEAKTLATYMKKIGTYYKKEVICVFTNMDIPLGCSIGNSLEVFECIDFLNDIYTNNLYEVVYTLASIIVSRVFDITYKEAFIKVRDKVKSKEAYHKFLEFIKYQGGDINKLKKASNLIEVKSDKSGYLNYIDAFGISKLTLDLGALRLNKEDKIDYEVGINLNKSVSDYVNVGDTLCTIYYNDKMCDIDFLKSCFKVENDKKSDLKIIYGIE